MTKPLAAPKHWLLPERAANPLESAGDIRRDMPCEYCGELGQWVRAQSTYDGALCVDPLVCSLVENGKRRVG